jgi:hypothetical protein
MNLTWYIKHFENCNSYQLILENSVFIAQKTRCVSVIRNNMLMTFTEIIAVYRESHIKHVHILSEQNVEIFNFMF